MSFQLVYYMFIFSIVPNKEEVLMSAFDSVLCDSAFENLNNYNYRSMAAVRKGQLCLLNVAMENLVQAGDVNQCCKSFVNKLQQLMIAFLDTSGSVKGPSGIQAAY